MLRQTGCFLFLLAVSGCHHFTRCDSCDEECERRPRRARHCREADRQCYEADVDESCSAPPPHAPVAHPQSPVYAQHAPMYAAPQQYYGVQQSPMIPSGPQEMKSTLGFSVARLPIPVLKLYGVPKPQQAQMVSVQQPPMMAAPMMMPSMGSPMMMPQMGSPLMMSQMASPQAAPSCPSTDSAQTALMMSLLQQSQQRNSVQSAPSYEDAELESRARKLEDRIEALTKALDK